MCDVQMVGVRLSFVLQPVPTCGYLVLLHSHLRGLL